MSVKNFSRVRSAEEVGLVSLGTLLQTKEQEKLEKAARKIESLPREELSNRFRTAFLTGQRVSAYLFAEELTKRGIPPCFRLSHLSSKTFTVNQRFDLYIYDLRWLATYYPEQAKQVKHSRYSRLFKPRIAFSDAERLFFFGNTPAWQLVKKLRLEEIQQWDCAFLRSAPVANKAAAIAGQRDKVFEALMDGLPSMMKTGMSEDDAKAAVIRRHQLWLCSRMEDGSPTKTARRYEQLTGQAIGANVVAKQLQKVAEQLRKRPLQHTTCHNKN